MAENQLEGNVLGVSWDGTGYGLDDTIWGGEFLLTDETSFERVATFKQFRLPGGERAIKEPRRTALGEFRILNCESRIGQSAISSKSPPKADSDNPQSPIIIDWSPTIHSILEDTRTQTPPAVISAKFHNTLTEIIIKTARMADEERVK